MKWQGEREVTSSFTHKLSCILYSPPPIVYENYHAHTTPLPSHLLEYAHLEVD